MIAVALVINFPKVADQRARIDAHAKSALLMASILLAAGAFTDPNLPAGYSPHNIDNIGPAGSINSSLRALFSIPCRVSS